MLLCGHAMMARGGYLAGAFAEHLAGRGVDVYALDWRGHGESVPPAAARGDDWGFERYVHQDLPAALRAVSEDAEVAEGELCYLGHSLGGVVALAALGLGTVVAPRKLTLWSTSLWLPGPQGSRWRRHVLGSAAALASACGRAPVRRFRAGSDDEPATYVAQLAEWARSGRWRSPRGVDYEALLGGVDVDTWAVVGDGDRLCRPGDAARFLAALSRARPLRRVGRRHGDALDADHFTLFTRRALAPLWDELVDFLGG